MSLHNNNNNNKQPDNYNKNVEKKSGKKWACTKVRTLLLLWGVFSEKEIYFFLPVLLLCICVVCCSKFSYYFFFATSFYVSLCVDMAKDGYVWLLWVQCIQFRFMSILDFPLLHSFLACDCDCQHCSFFIFKKWTNPFKIKFMKLLFCLRKMSFYIAKARNAKGLEIFSFSVKTKTNRLHQRLKKELEFSGHFLKILEFW